jgi:hypothetical protein
MARKAPKNPISDIVDTVGAWFGGSKGRVTNPQVQAAMDATRAIGKVVDTATGGFGQAVVSDAQRMAASGSSTPSALYKTAAVNLGAAAAGVGAAKIAAKTGIPARVANKVRGEVVGLHGSPVKGLKSIDPRISRSDVDIPTVSIMRTDVPPQLRAQNINVNQQYAGGQGSIYVVKAQKASTDLPKFPKPTKAPKRADGRPTLQLGPSAATKSRASTRVVAEVPIQNYPTEAALRQEIAKQVRLAGSSMRTKTAQQTAQDVISGVKKKVRKPKPAPGVS